MIRQREKEKEGFLRKNPRKLREIKENSHIFQKKLWISLGN